MPEVPSKTCAPAAFVAITATHSGWMYDRQHLYNSLVVVHFQHLSLAPVASWQCQHANLRKPVHDGVS